MDRQSALDDFITMSAIDTPTRAGRIGVRFVTIVIIGCGIAASLAACSRSLMNPPGQVVFVNFDHERARFAFARFVAACEALRIQERHHVVLEFVGVDVMDPLALSGALQRELAEGPVAIVAPTSPVLMEAVRLTSTTPIVFFTHQDPIDLKLASSLTHRRDNVAGISIYLGIEMKMLELLREVSPHARRIGFIVDSDEALRPNVREFLEATSRRHGIDWRLVAVKSIDTFADDVRAAGPMDAWFVTKAAVLDEHRVEFLAVLSATHRPAIYPSQVDVAAGAPLAYEAVFDDPNGALARQLDRVLSGVMPGEIPIERPKRFRLSLNVAAAQAAGMRLTPELLSQADKVR
jgi:putative ABC transport system substrate-binding protein